MERASAHIQRLPPNMVAQVSRIHKGTEWTAAVVWPYRSCPTCHSKCVTPLADCHRQSCVLPAVQVQASDRFALIFLGRHLGDCVWVWTAHRQDGSGVPFAELRPFDRQARLGEHERCSAIGTAMHAHATHMRCRRLVSCMSFRAAWQGMLLQG